MPNTASARVPRTQAEYTTGTSTANVSQPPAPVTQQTRLSRRRRPKPVEMPRLCANARQRRAPRPAKSQQGTSAPVATLARRPLDSKSGTVRMLQDQDLKNCPHTRCPRSDLTLRSHPRPRCALTRGRDAGKCSHTPTTSTRAASSQQSSSSRCPGSRACASATAATARLDSAAPVRSVTSNDAPRLASALTTESTWRPHSSMPGRSSLCSRRVRCQRMGKGAFNA